MSDIVQMCEDLSGITATEKKEDNLNIINIAYTTYKILKQPANRGTLQHSCRIESFHFPVDWMTKKERTKNLCLNLKQSTLTSEIT